MIFQMAAINVSSSNLTTLHDIIASAAQDASSLGAFGMCLTTTINRYRVIRKDCGSVGTGVVLLVYIYNSK